MELALGRPGRHVEDGRHQLASVSFARPIVSEMVAKSKVVSMAGHKCFFR
jgi:hypothetical protein